MNEVKIWLILIIILSLCFSCSKKQNDQESLRLVYPEKVNYEAFIIAKELNFYEEVGLKVKISPVIGGINAAEAMMAGAADSAAMGDAPAVILVSKNAPVKIVVRYGEGTGIHRLVSRKEIRQPAELKGKRIGLQSGSSTYGGFLLWADRNGLDLNSMNIIPMDPLNMPEAMRTNQLDAIAGSEPWPSNVEKLCGENVHELANFRNLGNTFPHVLIMSDRFLSKQPDAALKLIRAISLATDYLNENPEEAAKITSKYTGLTIDNQQKCTSLVNWKTGWDERDLRSLEITARYLKQFDKIKEIPEFGDFIKTDF
ncbi:MAG: ABC transporter substrate-binding protein [Desulfatiglans sp.]|nr:ABC transporter substrate-binding protein [Desulfatiglans sp.]